MRRTMTKDEFYAEVVKCHDKGYNNDDVMNILLTCVIDGDATLREICRYGKWIDRKVNKKLARQIIKEERMKRRLAAQAN